MSHRLRDNELVVNIHSFGLNVDLHYYDPVNQKLEEELNLTLDEGSCSRATTLAAMYELRLVLLCEEEVYT